MGDSDVAGACLAEWAREAITLILVAGVGLRVLGCPVT